MAAREGEALFSDEERRLTNEYHDQLRDADYLHTLHHEPRPDCNFNHNAQAVSTCYALLSNDNVPLYMQLRAKILLFEMTESWDEKEHLRREAEALYTALGRVHQPGDFVEADTRLQLCRQDLDSMMSIQKESDPDLADPQSDASIAKAYEDEGYDYDYGVADPEEEDDGGGIEQQGIEGEEDEAEEEEEEAEEEEEDPAEMEALTIRRREIKDAIEKRLRAKGLIQEYESLTTPFPTISATTTPASSARTIFSTVSGRPSTSASTPGTQMSDLLEQTTGQSTSQSSFPIRPPKDSGLPSGYTGAPIFADLPGARVSSNGVIVVLHNRQVGMVRPEVNIQAGIVVNRYQLRGRLVDDYGRIFTEINGENVWIAYATREDETSIAPQVDAILRLLS